MFVLLDCVLDENVVEYIEEEGFVEPEDQDQDHFVEKGKLLSELASIYIYFGSPVLLIKSISDLCGGCH